jgi:hypothetical protein
MISVGESDLNLSEENLTQCIIPKTLLLTRKNKHKELKDAQKYRTIVIRKPGSHKYKFEFTLSTEDTALTKMYLYQKNFTTLPKNTVLLWVCSIDVQKYKTPTIINFGDLDWHFSVVETDQELNGKHKGIISKLKKYDLLLSAGEMYYTDTNIYWNNTTGCLKKSMLINEERIGKSFKDHVLIPIFASYGNSFVFKAEILKEYAPKITYEYCNLLYKKNILTDSTKEKICGC